MNRLFICDPMCVLPFGHNVAQLLYFREYLHRQFSDVILIGCEALPDHIATDTCIARFYKYYYNDFVPVHEDAIVYSWRDGLVADPIEALAIRDANRFLNEYQIDKSDTIFFPSVDFYGLFGLLSALDTAVSSETPRLLLRFIGVMEAATKAHSDGLGALAKRISESIAFGVNVFISAETPVYADFLSTLLGVSILVTPYPRSLPYYEVPLGPPFHFYLPGSARHDKGFFELLDIFKTVRLQDPDLNVHFVFQLPPDRDLRNHRVYTSQLLAIPGTYALPASISKTDMETQYKRAFAIILPYDRDIYRLRGSAVTFESASIGRQIITYAGTGFASQIEYYGLGTVCAGRQEMASQILKLTQISAPEMTRRSLQSNRRFFVDVNAAYQAWMAQQ